MVNQISDEDICPERPEGVEGSLFNSEIQLEARSEGTPIPQVSHYFTAQLRFGSTGSPLPSGS